MGITPSFRKKSKKTTDAVDEPPKPVTVDVEEDACTETDKSSDSVNIPETSLPIPTPVEEAPTTIEEYDSGISPYDEATDEEKGKQTSEEKKPVENINVAEEIKCKETSEIKQESEIESLTLCQDWCSDDVAEQQKSSGTNADYPDDEVCDGAFACFDEPDSKSKMKYKTAEDENTETGIFCSWF